MRNLKRALSLLLSSTMVLGMVVMGSSAASYPDVTSEENVEAIEVLNAVGAMVGDNNGNFNPNALVTREEMAVVMCRLLDYTVSSYKGTTKFTDVSPWALPYVEACYTNGIIAGYSETQFGAKDSVTTGQAALMIMKALGYFQEAGDFGTDWLVETVKTGAQIQLFDGVANGANEALTRNDVAQMALNGLKADCVEITSHDLVSDGNGGFATKANYGSRTQVASINTIIDNSTGGLQLGEDLYRGDLVEAAGDESFGRPSTTWTYEGDKVGTYADTPDAVVAVDKSTSYNAATAILDLEDVLTGGDYHNLKIGTNTKQNNYVDTTASATAKTAVYVNGVAKNGVTGASTAPSAIPVYVGDTVEIYKNQYGFVTTVVVTRYELAKVDSLNDNVSSTDAAKGTKYYIDLVDLDDSVVGTGTYKDDKVAGFSTELFAEGNMVAVALNGAGEIIDSYAVKTVSGGISAYKTTDTSAPFVTVDGTKYVLNNDALSNGSADENTVDFVDGTYNVYLDANGYAMGVEGTYKVAIEDVYYVTGAVGTVTGTFDTAKYYAQAVSVADGTVKEILLETDSYEAISGKTAYQGINGDVTDLHGTPNLYSFTDNDAGTATIAKDSDNTKNDSYERKANNGKFTAKAYTGDGNDIGVVGKTTSTILGADLKRGDTSMELNSTKLYLNSTTKYIVVEGTEDAIDVSVYTGGVSVDDTDVTTAAYAVYLKDGSAKVASYVILAGTSIGSGTASTADVAYVASQPSIKVDGGWQTDLYLMDGTVLEGVTVTSKVTAEAFYKFTEKDGKYTLTSYTTAPGTKDGTGCYDDVLLESIYNDGITLAAGYADLDASGAKIIDTRTSGERDADVITTEITTLAQLKTALKNSNVVIDVFMDDEKVLVLSVIALNDVVKVADDVAIAGTSGELAAAAEGAYTGTVTTMGTAGLTGIAAGNAASDAILTFKFVAPKATADYALEIKDSNGNVYYTEGHDNQSWAVGSAHYFFLNLTNTNGFFNGAGADHTNTGSWTSGAMATGTYTYTITCDGVVIQSGSFTA